MKNPSELSDREIIEAMLQNSRTSAKCLKSITGWATFIGVLLILSIISGIIISFNII